MTTSNSEMEERGLRELTTREIYGVSGGFFPLLVPSGLRRKALRYGVS